MFYIFFTAKGPPRSLQRASTRTPEQLEQVPSASQEQKADEQKKRKRRAPTNRRFRDPGSMDKRAQKRHDSHGIARIIFNKIISFLENKECIEAELSLDQISIERRVFLKFELSNLLMIHDDKWLQTCVDDIQGINQAISDSGMQYTMPPGVERGEVADAAVPSVQASKAIVTGGPSCHAGADSAVRQHHVGLIRWTRVESAKHPSIVVEGAALSAQAIFCFQSLKSQVFLNFLVAHPHA